MENNMGISNMSVSRGEDTAAQRHRVVPKAVWEVVEMLGPGLASLVTRGGPL